LSVFCFDSECVRDFEGGEWQGLRQGVAKSFNIACNHKIRRWYLGIFWTPDSGLWTLGSLADSMDSRAGESECVGGAGGACDWGPCAG